MYTPAVLEGDIVLLIPQIHLCLYHLDDAKLLEPTGQLTDCHGCPAYVCPEMLQPGSYSGKVADIWSLGINIYTLLVGHYPLFDTNPRLIVPKNGFILPSENSFPDPMPSFLATEHVRSTTKGAERQRKLGVSFSVCLQRLREDGGGE